MRTPEQGHTKRCLAASLICVIENERDYDGLSDVQFVIEAPRFLEVAFDYLNNGDTTCICPEEGE